jgi:hypothetical protein
MAKPSVAETESNTAEGFLLNFSIIVESLLFSPANPTPPALVI